MEIQEAFDKCMNQQITWEEFKREAEKQGYTVHLRLDPLSCCVSKVDKRGRFVWDLL